MIEYWLESVSQAMDEAGILYTREQALELAQSIEGAHENYSTYTGRDCISDPRELEIEKLKKDLRAERNKIVCPDCGGKGYIRIDGPSHYSMSSCHSCCGEGRK